MYTYTFPYRNYGAEMGIKIKSYFPTELIIISEPYLLVWANLQYRIISTSALTLSLLDTFFKPKFKTWVSKPHFFLKSKQPTDNSHTVFNSHTLLALDLYVPFFSCNKDKVFS